MKIKQYLAFCRIVALYSLLIILSILVLNNFFILKIRAQIQNPTFVIQGGYKTALKIKFSPDGKYMAVSGANGLSIWDAVSRQELRMIKCENTCYSFVFYDNKYLATAGENDLSLWDVNTGVKTKSFKTETSGRLLQLSDKGILFVTVAESQPFYGVKLIDITKSQVIGELDVSGNTFAVSKNGELIATATNCCGVSIWNVGQNTEAVKMPNSDRSNSNGLEFVTLAFSADGKFLVGRHTNGAVKIWDVVGKKEMPALIEGDKTKSDVDFTKEPPTNMSQAFEMFENIANPSPDSLAFSSDGKFLAAFSGKNFYLWDWQQRKLISEIPRITFTDSLSKMKDIKDLSDSPFNSVSQFFSQMTVAISFTPDNKYLVLDRGKGIEFFQIGESTSVLKNIGKPSSDISLHSLLEIQFSDRGKWLGIFGGGGLFFDLASGNIQTVQTGLACQLITINANEQNVVCLSRDGTIELKNIDGFSEDSTLGKAPEYRFEPANPETDITKLIQNMPPAVVFSASSPDGQYILSAEKRSGIVRLWNVAQRREVKTLTLKNGEQPLLDGTSLSNGIAYHHQSQTLVTVTKVGTVNFWNLQSGKISGSIKNYESQYPNLFGTVSPDGKRLTITDGKSLKLWDVKTRKEFKSLIGAADGVEVEKPFFSADGSLLIACNGKNKGLKFWQTENGSEAASFPEIRCTMGISLSPDKKTLAVVDWEKYMEGLYKTDLFDVESRQIFASVLVSQQGDWLVKTPDGRFDTNRFESNGLLAGVFPDEPSKAYPLEIFVRDYYEPRLLTRLLNKEDFPAIRDISSLNRAQPKITISPSTKVNPDKTINVSVEVSEVESKIQKDENGKFLRSGVFDVRLFRDGSLVASSTSDKNMQTTFRTYENFDEELAVWREAVKVDLVNGKKTLMFKVKLPNDLNNKQVEFSAYAFNNDRVISDTVRATYAIPANANLKPAPRRAYVVTFGVNKFDNPAWDLKFAGNDARVMSETFSVKLRELEEFAEVVEIPLISDDETLNNQKIEKRNATKRNVQTVFDLLAGKAATAENLKDLEKAVGAETLKKIKQANPDDIILLSFSSHGYADKNGIFYILPTDIGKNTQKKVTDELLGNSISSDELSLWLRDVDAGEMVMIVDACHAASAVEGKDFKPAPMGSRGLGQLAFDKGMKILTATQAVNVANEIKEIKEGDKIKKIEQGLLTYVLIQDGLLDNAADFKEKDKIINLKEWLEFAELRVPILYEKWRELKEAKSKEILPSNPKTEKSIQQPYLFDFTRKKKDFILSLVP